MLKWAVNGPRQSYLPTVGESEVLKSQTNTQVISRRSLNSLADTISPNAAANAERRRLRRKSSDICSLRRKLRSQDKENQLTSTPLPVAMRANSPASLRKLGSLKDLSNITPDGYCGSPLSFHTPKRRALLCTTERQPNSVTRTPASNIPTQYASTLPTFDVEYSPCGLIPGPILALRGIGIADTYFEKPRYLTQEFQKELKRQEDKSTLPATRAQLYDEESSLSSSKMGDMTLERMIDAILESARKDRKIPKCLKQTATSRPTVMSPTYTPAEDPASDLHEFWDVTSEKYHQRQEHVTKKGCRVGGYNEREVRSPLITRSKQQQQLQSRAQQSAEAFQLRRQRAVRRKRRMSVLTNKMKNSAQKMFTFGVLENTTTTTTTTHCKNQLKHCGNDDNKDVKQVMRNTSPDSGRNSCSDYEDSTLQVGANDGVGEVKVNGSVNNTLDATKRRLSFSCNEVD